MTAITIRDVPEPILRDLKRKAADAGKSLQAYLLDLVSRDAVKESTAQIMARVSREVSASLETSDILDAIDGGREKRW
jgi:plasmid stability protein